MSNDVRMGWGSKLGYADSNPGSPPADPTNLLEFFADQLTSTEERQNADGLTGQLGFYADRFVKMSAMSQGAIVIEPKPTELIYWLPKIMGAAGSAVSGGISTYKTGNVLPLVDLWSLRGDGTYIFREHRVASATFEAGEGQRLRLTLNLMGNPDHVADTGYTWPTNLTYERATPWTFGDATMTIGGSAYKFYRFAFSVDFMLQPKMMGGSYSPTEYPSSGRRVMLGFSSPWGNGLPLANSFATANASAVITMSYGSGNDERRFRITAPNCRPPANRIPPVPGREEIRYDVELQALLAQGDGESEATIQLKTA